MLVLFESPAGYALFKVTDEGKLENPDDIWKAFSDADSARKLVKLKAFTKFENTTEALEAATALVESKLSKGLKKFLKNAKIKEELAVADAKLGGVIKEKLEIPCIANAASAELMRGIRAQITELVSGLTEQDMKNMALGLSHSLSRYKLKFSPDKIDTMIVQAIGLLDELDKELNTYAMRVREWYGWHFPELTKIISDNIVYAKVVKAMGIRQKAKETDLSDVLAEELEQEVRDMAEISMGTDISDEDKENIVFLCEQVIAIAEYRTQLFEYLKNRMLAIAPNLTVLVGELVGARLIAHAGSLLNLAKHPASTVQILGAEKALFRALKTKHDTPKYGLIYHASLIGQTAPKFKGKISRVLAAKCALAIRVDALGDKDTPMIGVEQRAKVEARLKQLEGKPFSRVSGTGKGKAKLDKYDAVKPQGVYNTGADSTLPKSDKKKKRAAEEEPAEEPAAAEEPPKKKKKSEAAEAPAEDSGAEGKKKKKKQKEAAAEEEAPPVDDGEKKKKKKKKAASDDE
eukprot:tig00021350_g20647.t1